MCDGSVAGRGPNDIFAFDRDACLAASSAEDLYMTFLTLQCCQLIVPDVIEGVFRDETPLWGGESSGTFGMVGCSARAVFSPNRDNRPRPALSLTRILRQQQRTAVYHACIANIDSNCIYAWPD